MRKRCFRKKRLLFLLSLLSLGIRSVRNRKTETAPAVLQKTENVISSLVSSQSLFIIWLLVAASVASVPFVAVKFAAAVAFEAAADAAKAPVCVFPYSDASTH